MRIIKTRTDGGGLEPRLMHIEYLSGVIPIPADYAELRGDIRQCQYGRGGTTAQTLSALLTRTSEQHTPCVRLLHHSQVQVQVQVHGEPQLP